MRAQRLLICAALSTLIASAATAAPIWMRRSEVSLPISGEECIARAFRSFRAEGFTPNQNLANGVWGSKGSRWTLILCNAAPGGQTWVNIVSSALEAEADAHYADHERVGARMGEAASGPPPQQGRMLRVEVTPQRNALVDWSNGTPDEGAWVSVVPVGTPDGQHVGKWVYTKAANSGRYDSGILGAGDYEARFYADSSYDRIVDRLRFSVVSAAPGRFISVKTSGRVATLTWRDAPPDTSAWVSIVPVGTPDDQYPGPWAYTSGKANGVFESPALAPGAYEARLYANGTYNVFDRIRFTVY